MFFNELNEFYENNEEEFNKGQVRYLLNYDEETNKVIVIWVKSSMLLINMIIQILKRLE